MRYDASLNQTVYQQRYPGFVIQASITRFGTLAVFASTDDMSAHWQGDSIIHAREWVDSKPKRDSQTPDLTPL